MKRTLITILVALAMLMGPGGCDDQQSETESSYDDTNITELTTVEAFNDVVLKSDKIVLVEFFATWCPPCKTLAPRIAKLSEELAGKVTFVKVDVDKARQISMRYGIESYPTVLLFKNGAAVRRIVGAGKIKMYRDTIESLNPKDTKG